MFVMILVNVIRIDIVASIIVTVMLATKNNKSIINIDQIMTMTMIIMNLINDHNDHEHTDDDHEQLNMTMMIINMTITSTTQFHPQ